MTLCHEWRHTFPSIQNAKSNKIWKYLNRCMVHNYDINNRSSIIHQFSKPIPCHRYMNPWNKLHTAQLRKLNFSYQSISTLLFLSWDVTCNLDGTLTMRSMTTPNFYIYIHAAQHSTSLPSTWIFFVCIMPSLCIHFRFRFYIEIILVTNFIFVAYTSFS